MAARLVFLGRLEDVAGTAEMMVEAGPIAAVIAALEPALAATVREPRIRIARNGELIPDRDAIVVADGDEIAFLPPVSGG